MPIHTTWLESFDPPLLRKIISYLPKPPQDSALLSLAEINPSLRSVVLEELSNTLHLKHSHINNIRWLNLVRGVVQKLKVSTRNTPNQQFPSLPPFAETIELLNADQLESVEIPDSKDLLLGIESSLKISSLTLHLDGRTSATEIANIITSLQLTTLNLKCCSQESNTCYIQQVFWYLRYFAGMNPQHWASSITELGASCQNVRHPDNLLPLLQLFPNIKTLTIEPGDISMSHHDLNFLRRANDVRISYARQALYFVEQLHCRVTVLKITDHALDESHLYKLYDCPKMTELDVIVKPGCENTIAGLIARWDKLEKLKLTWDTRHDAPPAHLDNELIAALSRHITPNLKVLKLCYVAISETGIDQLISVMGERMVEFETSIERQTETPCERMGRIVENLIIHCPNIRKFGVTEDMRSVWDNGSMEGKAKKAKWLLYVLERLKRTVPEFDDAHLRENLTGMLRMAEGQTPPFITPVNSAEVDPSVV